MSNEKAAGELVGLLLDIYKTKLDEMKADPDNINASLLREVREFLKQHDIELDANAAPLQDLKDQHDEVTAWRERRG
jgi:hypothetical protein